jgi:hypothetical protein
MAFETARIDNTTTRRVLKDPYASARGWRHWIQFPLYVPVGYRGRMSCLTLSHLRCHGVGVRRVQRDGPRVIGKVSSLHVLRRQSRIRRADFNHSLTKKGTL